MRKLMVATLSLACILLIASFAISADRKEADRDSNVAVKKAKSTQTATTNPTPTKSDEKAETQTEPPVQQQAPTSDPLYQLTGEEINWFVISNGATNASSTNYQLQGTVGQFAVGNASSTNYQVKSGYWQDFSSGGGGCCVLRGNINGTGGIDISDLTYLVAYMFNSGPPPPCEEEGNVNATGGIDISDLTALVSFMFGGGSAPPPC